MSLFNTIYDVIVIGGGHAGSEAAAASANMGASTLLITMNLQNIAQMSCNPAMGGIAKGQIIREIDALGGYSGIVTDKTAIQFKMLNKSKGPAMWSPRAQSDRMMFAETWRNLLENTKNLDFYQDSVNGLLFDGSKIVGVKTVLGLHIKAKSVIVTAGTFLNGLIHIGEKTFGGDVCKIPDNLPPLDCNAEITFLAGDCNNVIISPISSSLDFTFTRDSSWSSPT